MDDYSAIYKPLETVDAEKPKEEDPFEYKKIDELLDSPASKKKPVEVFTKLP